MSDIIAEKFFTEVERWERAISKGADKKIMQRELKELTTPRKRQQIYVAMCNKKYKISAPHQAEIPKDDGTMRNVWVNENIDRIIASIYTDIIFEKPYRIHSCSRAYQKGIGTGKIINDLVKNITQYDKGIKVDFTKYFDTVPIRYIDMEFDYIDKWFGKSVVTDIFREYYHNNVCIDIDGNVIEKYLSLKQGSSFAAYLANSIMYELDCKLADLDGYYVRYCDDLIFIGKDYKKAYEIIKSTIESMDMTLNPNKVDWINSKEWFTFLGYSIKGTKVSFSKKRVNNFKKEIISRTTNCTMRQAINRVNAYLYKGNGEYSWASQLFNYINCEEDLIKMNNFIMDRIRACATGKRKRLYGLGYKPSDNGVIDYVSKGTCKSNLDKVGKDLSKYGYYSLICMRNKYINCRELYRTYVMNM